MDLAGKLQLKPGQSVALVAQPEGVGLDLGDDHPVAGSDADADALIAFCRDSDDLKRLSGQFVSSARRDSLTWVAYPKAGQLGTDLNRDVLAEQVKGLGVQPVRQVALDDVWSALRLRPA